MKLKTLNKNLIIFLTMLTMIMSVFMLSACGKKDPEEKPFEARTLTVEQAQSVFNEAVTKAKQSTNVSVEASGDDFSWKYLATAECFYEEDDGVQFEWTLYEDGVWVDYSAIFMDDEYKHTYKRTNETDANTGIELLFDYYMFPVSETEITGGTQIAENVYSLTIEIEEGNDSNKLNFEVVDGYIVGVTNTVTEAGETATYVFDFEYNVEDLEIPQLPDVEWIEN